MSKLYAITSGEYSDYGIITLCSDRERAEKLVEWYNRYEKYDKAEIEEYEDGIIIPDESVKPYEVTFRPDGSIRWTSQTSPGHAVDGGYVLECFDGCHIIYVLATDEESAEKIAAEKRAKYIAERTGVV